MRIGFSQVLDDGKRICADATTKADSLENFNEYLCGGDNEPAIDFLSFEGSACPEECKRGLAALDALAATGTDEGSICAALEHIFAKIYQKARAKGRSETLEDINAVAEQILGKGTGKS